MDKYKIQQSAAAAAEDTEEPENDSCKENT